MKLKFNLTELLFKLFIDEKKIRDKAIERGELMSLYPQIDAEAAEIARNLLENGIPTTEFDWVSDAIVYLYFDGIIYESEEVVNELQKEIISGSFDAKVISKMTELKPYGFYAVEINQDTSSYSLNDYVPYYLLQKKACDFTSKWIEQSRAWVKKHPHRASSAEHHGGYYRWSVWLKNETPPHEKPEWKQRIKETQSAYYDAKKRRENPLYGGRPREVLIAPRPDLQESLSWWSGQLFSLIGYLNSSHDVGNPINVNEYYEVALEIGERCVKLLPKAKDDLKFNKIQSEKNAYSEAYKQFFHESEENAFKENKGMARYAELLVKYCKLEDALLVCEQCIKYGVHDGTKSGFPGRASKIKNKIAKLTPKSELKNSKAK